MSGFQFRKRFKIAPWITLNISKTGASLSLGPSNFHITTGKRGTWLYMDLPGSGAYYRKKLDSTADSASREAEAEPPPPEKLNLTLFERMTKSTAELHLVEALRAFNDGDEALAYRHAAQAVELADGAFLAGVLALKQGENEPAVASLLQALQLKDDLGQQFASYELHISLTLPITEEIAVEVEPNERGVRLALTEAYQQLDLIELAIEQMQQLLRLTPDDLITRLSLAELYDLQYPEAEQMQRRTIELAEGIHNTSPIHASLMYYRARALRRLGLYEAAKDTLSKALRRRKNYPEDLLRALRYEQALVYEALGQEKKARTQFQKIFAEAPDYEDVAAKLGL